MEANKQRKLCPSCGRWMDADGWCGRCANFRQLWITLALFLLIPCLGFSACYISYSARGPEASTLWIVLGGYSLVVGPGLAIVFTIGMTVWRIFRKRKKSG